MWRNSVTFSARLLPKTDRNPYGFLSPGTLLRPFSYTHSLHLHSSFPPNPPPSDPLKLGLVRSDAVRSFSATIGGSEVASTSLVIPKLQVVVDGARQYGRCYWELSKARLSMLVVATSGTGFVLGSGSAIDIPTLCFTCAGTMMVAASANSFNQVFEINNDAKMKRTMLRPLPSGRISRSHAVTWALSVGAAGTALLACKANMLAAGLAATNLGLYALVYTPLKQIHPVNTWVGAVVGAIPPLLGWAAATGDVSLNAMILPAALYFWQIPHFMALAYLCRDDYAAGGFKMLSLFDATGRRTASVALRNCVYLIPLGFIAYDWGLTTGWFCWESSLLAAAISATAVSFFLNRTTKNARRMFHASLLYLPVFMSGLMLHRISENDQKVSSGLTYPDSLLQDKEDEHGQKRIRKSQPPVAYASVAPFPFLPAPSYAHP
ncbi:hypothetical protein QQ045_021611 [Rhodiola kirilowii]